MLASQPKILMASGINWIIVIPESLSTSSRDKERKQFEHYFSVDYDDDKPIKLLRIDIWDNFYLDEFSLIYLDTNENLNMGMVLRTNFRSTFVFPPRKGQYKIVTKGGSYKYCVRLLENDGPLQIRPDHKALNSYKVYLSIPMEEEPFKKQFAYRVVGSDKWEILPDLCTSSEYSTRGHVVLQVDPQQSYETKAKVLVEGLFETEYSEPSILDDHKTWIDQFRPNDPLFLLHHGLRFEMNFYCWPTDKDLILRVKLGNEEDWISFEKLYKKSRRKIEYSEPIVFDLSSIYDQLPDDDETFFEWKLVFRDQATKQEHEGEVNFDSFTKREKFQGSERVKKTYVFQEDCVDASTKIHLCRNGVFRFEHPRIRKLVLKGRYRLKALDGSDTEVDIIFVPDRPRRVRHSYELSDNIMMNTDTDNNHPIWSLFDVATMIFKTVFSLNEENEDNHPLESLISINLICKQWYKIFWQSFELHGRWHGNRIKIFGWKQGDEKTGEFNQLRDLNK